MIFITLCDDFVVFLFSKVLPTLCANIITSFLLYIAPPQMSFFLKIRMRTRFVSPLFTKFFRFRIVHIISFLNQPNHPRLAANKKRKRGISSLLVPRSEAFALPNLVERATSKPTPICIHLSLYGYTTLHYMQSAIPVKGCG